MNEALLSPDTHRLIRHLAHHELVLPVLCFLAGHRPLAFVVSQCLYLTAPLALLLGQQQWLSWAELLASTQGMRLIEGIAAKELNYQLASSPQSPER